MKMKARRLKFEPYKPKAKTKKERFVEAILGVTVLLALFWSLVVSNARIDQTTASVVPNSYYWWALGVAALATGFFSSLLALLALKIHKHPLPILLILTTILSLTLLLVSGWQPVIKM